MVLLRQRGGATTVPIEYRTGNLLEDDAEALVNTVNCVGVMGKGIALQFKQAYPRNFGEYEKACRKEEVRLGHMFVFDTGDLFDRKVIINFPTKRHWKAKARLEDVAEGLIALVEEVKRLNLKSVAIPPLGCGNGGLSWDRVRPMIEDAFKDMVDVSVRVYVPAGTPDNDSMSVNTVRPTLTRTRALLLRLMHSYSTAEHRLSLLEVQKLAYFLQAAGEPLKLNFVKGNYGPYAENLNHVLQRLEGHFIRGYGDRSRDAQIRLLPDTNDEVGHLLSEDIDAKERLEQVSGIIWGFETPYGLELLATVHWCARSKRANETTLEELVESIHGWSQRKHHLFTTDHIGKAWDHLRSFRFLWNQVVFGRQ